MQVAQQTARRHNNLHPSANCVLGLANKPFQFINLRTLQNDGKSQPLSFQELPHSFLSHGRGATNLPLTILTVFAAARIGL